MDKLLASLPRTIHASLALAVVVFIGLFYQCFSITIGFIWWTQSKSFIFGLNLSATKYLKISEGWKANISQSK